MPRSRYQTSAAGALIAPQALDQDIYLMKKFFSSDWGFDIAIAFIFLTGGLAFVLIYYPHTYLAYPGVVAFALSYILTRALDLYASKAKLNGKILGPLQQDGFRVEHIDHGALNHDYWGLTGTYRGYPIRIYYGRGTGHKRASELFITLYFLPGTGHIERIRDTYVTPSQSGIRTYDYRLSDTAIERVDRYLYIFSYEGVRQRIDALVDIAVEGHLSAAHEQDIPIPKVLA